MLFLINVCYVLFCRLGGSVMHPDTKLPRITRSQVEPKETLNVEKSPEEVTTPEKEKLSPSVDESSKTNKETPKATRSLRLMKQQPDGKKVLVKKVVRVHEKGMIYTFFFFSAFSSVLHVFM